MQKAIVIIVLLLMVLPLAVHGNGGGGSGGGEILFGKEIQSEEIMTRIHDGRNVYYDRVIIRGDLDLSKLNLSEEPKIISSFIRIHDSTFLGSVNFYSAIFYSSIDFAGSDFVKDVNFSNSTFHSPVYFGLSKFGGNANFRDSIFIGPVSFVSSEFAGNAIFNAANFDNIIDFSNAYFKEDADFEGTLFNDNASFSYTRFDGKTNFEKAIINNSVGIPNVRNSEILGEITTILNNIYFTFIMFGILSILVLILVITSKDSLKRVFVTEKTDEKKFFKSPELNEIEVVKAIAKLENDVDWVKKLFWATFITILGILIKIVYESLLPPKN